MRMKIAAAVGLAALAAGCASNEGEAGTSITLAGAEACSADQIGSLDGETKWVEAAEGLPAYCEVTATLHPAEGSDIGVVYRLPESWNGKILGIGGGGWAGNVTLMAASEGLKKGYATLQTDGGNAGTDVWNNGWIAENPEAAKDFSYRAIHELTVAGKQLVEAVYGQKQDRAYFQGCSTGGRMALMEAQRFPDDYDAISAGAPVYSLQVQTSAVLRNNTFARNNGGFSAEDLQLANNAALAACDSADGVEDGIINDPRQCSWDPAELQCDGAKTDSCLAPAQVTALKTIYEGIRTPEDEWAMFPMSKGGETGWSLFVGTEGTGEDATGGGGLKNLEPLLFGGRSVDFATLSAEKDVPELRSSDFARMYEATDPDLSAFFANGGKLILWHGENDPGPSPVGANDYARAVLNTAEGASDNMRYFLLPGVEHCAGGPGADMIEWLDTLDDWASGGEAPERVIGTKRDGSLTRPHCAWPNVAEYKGEGEANDPANWQCVARKS
ncbi:feruloyl esterase [Altererythrobacter atlanticus]|uniref:Tannase and feruloyl esterase n=1 Tax=Croceibacterium atlanticum TaxID=1267766 RepID=A0A0F7KN65_9SPHN|nr:tannase/feruloyl esterase family alpha/beta hydrolase [Croceibacterium atlanticum]AKH41973.1 Tannase and feruloyl esterase [Croceibacterium atlanticum]MBB5733459.1 feruloyl esterase [Croceibacterium atlanticum]